MGSLKDRATEKVSADQCRAMLKDNAKATCGHLGSHRSVYHGCLHCLHHYQCPPPKPAPWEVAPALNPLQLAAIVDEYKDRERCARFLTTQPTVNNTVSLEQIQPVIWLLERLARLRRQHDMFSAALRQFLAASSQHVVPTAAACAGQPAPGAKPPPLSPPIAPGSPWPAVPWRPPQQAYPPLAIAPAIHQPPQLLVAPAAKQPALPGAPRPPPPYQPRPAHSTAASQLGTPNSR